MKITRSKEWWLRLAQSEPDLPCTAGVPDKEATMTNEEMDKLWGSLADATKRLAKLLTEQHCLRAINDAYERLKELGWKEMCGAPKDMPCEAIWPGATMIGEARWAAFSASFSEAQGDGAWIARPWEHWPSQPILYRPRERK